MSAISVLIPTYNRARFIGEALDSIASQTCPADEIIVIDDASTDDTERIVHRHPAASRVHYQRQSSTQGASVARNVGVALASGEVIVFLDSDDILEPDHHSRVLEILGSNVDIGLFCCDATMIDSLGRALDPHRTWTQIQCAIKNRRIASGIRSLSEIFLFSTPFPGLSVRRDVYLRVGGLDQNLFPLDDYDLQLKVAGAGHLVHYEHRPLARYRIHDANESGPGREILVGKKKLKCVQQSMERYSDVRALGFRAVRRRGEVRREMAIALIKERRYLQGFSTLILSICEEPAGISDLLRIARRKAMRVTP